jgi:hypothetical protein
MARALRHRPASRPSSSLRCAQGTGNRPSPCPQPQLLLHDLRLTLPPPDDPDSKLLFSAAVEGAENDVAFKFEPPAQVPMSREFEGSLSAHGGRP